MTAHPDTIALLRSYPPNTRVSTVIRRESSVDTKATRERLEIETMEVRLAEIARADVEREVTSRG